MNNPVKGSFQYQPMGESASNSGNNNETASSASVSASPTSSQAASMLEWQSKIIVQLQKELSVDAETAKRTLALALSSLSTPPSQPQPPPPPHLQQSPSTYQQPAAYHHHPNHSSLLTPVSSTSAKTPNDILMAAASNWLSSLMSKPLPERIHLYQHPLQPPPHQQSKADRRGALGVDEEEKSSSAPRVICRPSSGESPNLDDASIYRLMTPSLNAPCLP